VAGRGPPPAFATASLDIAHIPAGRIFGRIYRQGFSNPLGYGKSPSRFSDIRKRFRIIASA